MTRSTPPAARPLAAVLGAALALTVLTLPQLGCARPPSAEPERPNVLVVLVDALRADALGAYGATPSRMPVLDRLAERGLLFRRAYSNAPKTVPSVASLFTSTPPGSTASRPARGRRQGDGTFFAYVHLLDLRDYYHAERLFPDAQGADGSDGSISPALRELADASPSRIYGLLRTEPERFTPADAAFLRRAYDRELAATDELIGRLLAALEEAGVLEEPGRVVATSGSAWKLITDRWSYIVSEKYDREELYDLSADPGERHPYVLEVEEVEQVGMSEDVERTLRSLGYID